jgi:uracil-DNA glycosylase
VVVALGEQAYMAVLGSYGIKGGRFQAEVESLDGRVLPGGVACLAVYHCGRRVQNMYRSIDEQTHDWRRVASALTAGRLTMR